jgi:uncharacterized protein (TIGR02266 family)
MAAFDLVVFSPDAPHDEPLTLIRRRPQAAEQRSSARLPLEIDVEIEGAAHRFTATTADLSAGGMFVVTQRAMPIGIEVMLGFTLPNGKTLEVLGVVRWQTNGGDAPDGSLLPPGLGLSFYCLEPEVKAALADFCFVREPLYYANVTASGELERISRAPA